MENKFVEKLINNKLFLFIVPNLIYLTQLCNFFNTNFKSLTEVLFYEIFIVGGFLLIINFLIYLFLNKVLKDHHKVFCILCLISIFYFTYFNLITFLLYIVFILVLIFNFKKFINFKLDFFVVLISFISIALFAYSFGISAYHELYILFKSKSYDYDIKIEVDENLNTPNIYWIHCDGMMNTEAMKKYFNYKHKYLTDYLENNNFYVDKDSTLEAGHSTQKALVAMFNPDYYDNFYKKHLEESEEWYINNKKKPSFVVNYNELNDKRLNNELFKALEKKNYTTVGIAEFNPYTAFYTDYFYDYYSFGYEIRHIHDEDNELKLLKDNSKFRIDSYLRFTHLKALAYRTFFKDLISDINFLNYEEINYKNFDTSDYQYVEEAMNNSNYWLAKAILKGLDESMKIDDKKFVFIDFKLNHDPFTFDVNGNIISEDLQYNAHYYLGNYIYSSYLLVDMLEFIKNYDEDAVIIVQGDHGLHTIEDEMMLKLFATDMEGVQEIRNSVISAYYIPDKYRTGDEINLSDPLNVSRYLINNYIGKNYEYIK